MLKMKPKSLRWCLLSLCWLVGTCHAAYGFVKPQIPDYNSKGINPHNTIDTSVGAAQRAKPPDPSYEAFEACGLIKQCVSHISNLGVDAECIGGKTCEMMFAYGKALGESPAEDEAVFEIFAQARGWVAVGISRDEFMGDDYVVECAKEGSVVNLYNSWNGGGGGGGGGEQKNGGNRSNTRLRGNQSARHNIRPIKIMFVDNKIYCKFYIKKKFSKIDPSGRTWEFDLDNTTGYRYLMAISQGLAEPYGEDGNLRTHLVQGGVTQAMRSKREFVAGERYSPLPLQARYLLLHAIFMAFCWIFFMSISIFVARYLKETMPRVRILKREVWLFTHSFTSLFATVCFFASIGIQLHAGYNWKNLFRSNFHTYSGIVCFCLFITELISGFFMKTEAVAGQRQLLNKFHIVVGHFTYLLAFVNMAFSDRVAYGFLACSFSVYIIIWLVLYNIFHLLMTYHKCWARFVVDRGYYNERGRGALLQNRQSITRKKSSTASNSMEAASRFTLNTRASSRFSGKSSGALDHITGDPLAELEAAHGGIETLVLEAPGRYVRLWALIMFLITTAIYTYWAIRKLLSFPEPCYNFTALKDLETNGFN